MFAWLDTWCNRLRCSLFRCYRYDAGGLEYNTPSCAAGASGRKSQRAKITRSRLSADSNTLCLANSPRTCRRNQRERATTRISRCIQKDKIKYDERYCMHLLHSRVLLWYSFPFFHCKYMDSSRKWNNIYHCSFIDHVILARCLLFLLTHILTSSVRSVV